MRREKIYLYIIRCLCYVETFSGRSKVGVTEIKRRMISFYDLCELWQLTINNWQVKTVQNSDKTYFSEVIKGKIGQTILG